MRTSTLFEAYRRASNTSARIYYQSQPVDDRPLFSRRLRQEATFYAAVARRIEAADDLLAACEYAVDSMVGPDGAELTTAEKMAIGKMEAAIAAAKGE